MLYNLIITPIETIVGWVFFFFSNKFDMLGPAGAIIGVSLIINFLALPLYNIADSLQEKERKIQKSLEYRVKRIKKGFCCYYCSYTIAGLLACSRSKLRCKRACFI